MTSIRGIEHQARPLPLLVLADTSGSMSMNGKISSLNQALAGMVQDLQSDDQTRDSVLLSLIVFDTLVEEKLTLEPIQSVQLPTLTAQGQTSLGQAVRVALDQLGDPARLPSRCLSPVIVLATDGQPTDEWQSVLSDLKIHPRARSAIRLALAIGADADQTMLKTFASDEYPVLQADQPEKIKSFFKFVTWSAARLTKSGGRDRAGVQPPPDLLT